MSETINTEVRSQRDQIRLFKGIIATISLESGEKNVSIKEIYEEAEKISISKESTFTILNNMRRTGDIFTPNRTHIRLLTTSPLPSIPRWDELD